MDNKYDEVDKQIGEEIRAQMRAEGVTSYPAICWSCKGTGQIHGEGCPYCEGAGSYELCID